jgi:hypothetical protein
MVFNATSNNISVISWQCIDKSILFETATLCNSVKKKMVVMCESNNCFTIKSECTIFPEYDNISQLSNISFL